MLEGVLHGAHYVLARAADTAAAASISEPSEPPPAGTWLSPSGNLPRETDISDVPQARATQASVPAAPRT